MGGGCCCCCHFGCACFVSLFVERRERASSSRCKVAHQSMPTAVALVDAWPHLPILLVLPCWLGEDAHEGSTGLVDWCECADWRSEFICFTLGLNFIDVNGQLKKFGQHFFPLSPVCWGKLVTCVFMVPVIPYIWNICWLYCFSVRVCLFVCIITKWEMWN